VSFGYKHSLFLSKRGSVYGAGLNTNYQLGLGDKGQQKVHSSQIEVKPIKIESLNGLGIAKVIAGGFSAALTTQNQILVWGEGDFGVFKTPQKLYMDQVNFVDCQISKFQH
jgi:alpha-tubulin suppressor-like RCC1 family protein